MPDYMEFEDLRVDLQVLALVQGALIDHGGVVLEGPVGSGAGRLAWRLQRWRRPAGRFRAPHHTISHAGLFGNVRHPGELFLADGGLLMLGDAPEFRPELLRELYSGWTRGRVDLPTTGDRAGEYTPVRFKKKPLLVLGTRLCPCGAYSGWTVQRHCGCEAGGVLEYRDRLGFTGLPRVQIHKDTIKGGVS